MHSEVAPYKKKKNKHTKTKRQLEMSFKRNEFLFYFVRCCRRRRFIFNRKQSPFILIQLFFFLNGFVPRQILPDLD